MKRTRNRAGKKPAWNPDDWLDRCAWCEKKIPEDNEVFGIEVRLRQEAFLEIEPGTVHPLFLPSLEKTVPLLLVAMDSPAKRAGKDAMLQACCKPCAVALQLALRTELGGGEIASG